MIYAMADRDGTRSGWSVWARRLVSSSVGIGAFWLTALWFPGTTPWVVLAMILVAVFGLFIEATAWGRMGIEHARLQKGLCAGCAYDRQGIPVDAPCPECGRLPPRPPEE
jgi:hypothetical protein